MGACKARWWWRPQSDASDSDERHKEFEKGYDHQGSQSDDGGNSNEGCGRREDYEKPQSKYDKESNDSDDEGHKTGEEILPYFCKGSFAMAQLQLPTGWFRIIQ